MLIMQMSSFAYPERANTWSLGPTPGGSKKVGWPLIHVVYEKNEKPCGPFMATRSPPAPGLLCPLSNRD